MISFRQDTGKNTYEGLQFLKILIQVLGYASFERKIPNPAWPEVRIRLGRNRKLKGWELKADQLSIRPPYFKGRSGKFKKAHESSGALRI